VAQRKICDGVNMFLKMMMIGENVYYLGGWGSQTKR